MSDSLSLDIGGMTCDGCSERVKNALESILGVDSAKVSHESGIAIIEHRNVSRMYLECIWNVSGTYLERI